jgi:hypothetical protein
MSWNRMKGENDGCYSMGYLAAKRRKDKARKKLYTYVELQTTNNVEYQRRNLTHANLTKLITLQMYSLQHS